MEQGPVGEAMGFIFRVAKAAIRITVPELKGKSLLWTLMCGACCEAEQLEAQRGNEVEVRLTGWRMPRPTNGGLEVWRYLYRFRFRIHVACRALS